MMATPPPLFATVIHLPTGNVLAAVSSAGLEPTLEDLTATEPLRVRFPGTPGFVNVPISLLTAARVAVTAADVLDRPQHYVFGAGNPPVTRGAEPVVDGGDPTGAAGKQAIVVWQVGSESIVSRGPIGAHALPGPMPPGGTHRLLVYEGGPLHLDTRGSLS
jgi:hypothetical protein